MNATELKKIPELATWKIENGTTQQSDYILVLNMQLHYTYI